MVIVPSDQLLAATGLFLLPLTLLAAIFPAWQAVLLSLGGIVGLLAILDGWLGARRGSGLRISLPELLRMQKDRPATLEVRLRNSEKAQRELTLAVEFPELFRLENERLQVQVPAGAENALVAWTCSAPERGQFFIRRVWLESASPLRLWKVRESQPAACELRVYPNLFEERQAAAALFLNRGRYGIHAQRRAGKGRDFEKLRDYVHNDPLTDVHWKASARHGRLVTKVFQVERTQEIYVIIDASRLNARENALEHFVTSGLLLALAAEQQGDLFGLLTFDDAIRSFFRARNGMAHFDVCRDALYTLQPRPVSPDFEEVCAFIRTRLRKRALLVFLTSLDDPALAENFQRGISLLTGQHLVLVNMLRPSGVAPVFTEKADSLDSIYTHLADHLRWDALRELERKLKRQGAIFRLVEPGKLSPQLIRQYLEIKNRQLV